MHVKRVRISEKRIYTESEKKIWQPNWSSEMAPWNNWMLKTKVLWSSGWKFKTNNAKDVVIKVLKHVWQSNGEKTGFNQTMRCTQGETCVSLHRMHLITGYASMDFWFYFLLCILSSCFSFVVRSFFFAVYIFNNNFGLTGVCHFNRSTICT